MLVCVYVRARARVRDLSVRVCASACVSACVHECTSACVHLLRHGPTYDRVLLFHISAHLQRAEQQPGRVGTRVDNGVLEHSCCDLA